MIPASRQLPARPFLWVRDFSVLTLALRAQAAILDELARIPMARARRRPDGARRAALAKAQRDQAARSEALARRVIEARRAKRGARRR